MLGTELIVILVSEALRCQPSSVSADCVTSATGRGSAAATPPLTHNRAAASEPMRRTLDTAPIVGNGAEWFLASRPGIMNWHRGTTRLGENRFGPSLLSARRSG